MDVAGRLCEQLQTDGTEQLLLALKATDNLFDLANNGSHLNAWKIEYLLVQVRSKQ